MTKLFYLNTDVEIKLNDQFKNTTLIFKGYFKDLMKDFNVPTQYKNAVVFYDLKDHQAKVFIPEHLNLEIREV